MFNFKVNTNEIKTTSEFLNELVCAYRDGLSGSSEALLEAFEPLLSKYHRLLMDGIWDPSDKDAVKFLQMMGGPEPEKTASGLCRSVHRQFEAEDIRQELVFCLMVTAQKYTNISWNFKYVVRDRLKELFADRFVYDRAVDYNGLEDAYTFMEMGAIDKSWVKGITVGDGWDKLTSIQRAIIKYLYNDGLAEAVAAKKLKMSVRQLQRLKKRAEETLADHFKIPYQ